MAPWGAHHPNCLPAVARGGALQALACAGAPLLPRERCYQSLGLPWGRAAGVGRVLIEGDVNCANGGRRWCVGADDRA